MKVNGQNTSAYCDVTNKVSLHKQYVALPVIQMSLE